MTELELSPFGSLSAELRRLRRIGIEQALRELRATDRDVNERIHEARKQLKKLRALLRLASPELDEPVGAEDAILRRAARALSVSRDAAALHEALDELVADQPEGNRLRLAPHAEALHRALPGVASPDAAAAVAKALAALEPLSVRHFPGGGGGIHWSSLGRGFRRTYARARRALARALADPKSEHLHRFRTQVKRHQHQLDLLTPLWPKVVGARRHEVSRLGELIGSEHDLSELAGALERRDIPVETMRVIAPLLAERRERLSREALRLGQRAFAEPARRITARFETYLAVWREEAAGGRSLRSTKGSSEAPGAAAKRATG